MKIRAFLALLLAVLMTAAVFAACQPKKPANPTESGDTGAVSETDGGKPKDEIITSVDRQDYKGASFQFLTHDDQERFHKEIFVEIHDTQEVIYESVYRRNQYVNEYLNIVIGTEPTVNATQQAEHLVLSGDTTYEVYNLFKYTCTSMLVNGYTRDWMALDLNFENPWWNDKAFDALRVNDMLLLMSGSILITDIDDTIAMVYNQKIFDDYKETIGEDLYQTVLANEWTLDKFISVVTKVHDDLNADGVYDGVNDLLGYMAERWSMANNWGFAGGFSCGTIENGEYNLNMTPARIEAATDMVEKLVKMFKTDYADQSYDLGGCIQAFIDGRALMIGVILRNLEGLRVMKDDYGVLPYPKLDDRQTKYITHVGNASPIMMIPTQNFGHDDYLSKVLEAMCEASYRITRPAYYEIALKEKGARDEESKQILDIILDARVYDLAYITSQGGVITIGETIAAGSTAFARLWDRQSERIQRELQEMVDDIIENAAP